MNCFSCAAPMGGMKEDGYNDCLYCISCGTQICERCVGPDHPCGHVCDLCWAAYEDMEIGQLKPGYEHPEKRHPDEREWKLAKGESD